MRPINADNPRELEKFNDIVERTVVSLKENKKFADLKGGTLCAIVLEKLPQALLSQRGKGKKLNISITSTETIFNFNFKLSDADTCRRLTAPKGDL
ncbi:unnamed protein product, partial [Porites lobata]